MLLKDKYKGIEDGRVGVYRLTGHTSSTREITALRLGSMLGRSLPLGFADRCPLSSLGEKNLKTKLKH